MPAITVTNHGPLITATNYWDSEAEAAGTIWCSTNAGAIRVLIPRQYRAIIERMRASREVVLSLGAWPEQRAADAVELRFEDGTDSPFTLHLTPASFDLLPGEPEPGREWVLSVWDCKKGRPHKSIERVCHWRKVPIISFFQPWGRRK